MKGATIVHNIKFHLRVLLLACAASGTATATEMVYYPINPSFGGSPLNGSVLLNTALATNKHTNPDIDNNNGIEAPTQRSALQDFQESLERAVLSRLTSAATSKLFDSTTGSLIPGSLSTQNFDITITDAGGGLLSITTVDKTTGGSTTFQVDAQ